MNFKALKLTKFFEFSQKKAENFTSSLLSAFGLATGGHAAAPAPPTTNNQSRNNTNTTTTSTTASAGAQNPNQEGQLPRSRISQLFVPISMNRSRRVIIRRSSGRCFKERTHKTTKNIQKKPFESFLY